MEAAVVTVSTGVMKPLLSKLTNLLGEEYVKLKGVRKQIKFLTDELSAMSPTLQMLEDEEELDPEMRAWRDKLRDLAYDLEDCVDAFTVRVDHKQNGLSVFKWFSQELKKLKARHDLANQIKQLKASVIETSERHKRYDLFQAQLKNKSSSSSIDPRLQALYEDTDNLVGIDGPKKHIIDLLTMEVNGSSTKLKVVSVSGCGGLGKTTLAKQVYDDIKSQFKCAAFVSVSRTPDVRKILIHISDGVKCPGIIPQDADVQQLIDKLREHLHNKRYIVVIDDVWEVQAWESIKFALPNNDLGSRIITTTRSLAVAKYSSSQVYEMVPLSFDNSKRLFFKRSIGSENPCYSHLDDVPDRILRKCSGLPLAIVTVSSMLTNKHAKAEWDRVLNEIGSALANKTDAKKMTSILSLSFFDIPHHLRTCLLYLSVFPEDHEIEKQRLINRWIGEGFIHEEERRTKYEIGEGYFNDLINRSMIQPVNVEYGQAKACRVHDIILDYIKCKAAKENFVTLLDGAEPEYKYKVRRLCVSNHSEESVTLRDKILSHVRSVTIFGQHVKISLLPSTSLRVLDLDIGEHRGMKYNQLESIGKLFNLKYLRLYSRSITKLPENVGQLQHLQTLDVRGTRIKELPPTIIELQQLARLYVNWHARFPDGVIRRMLSLEEMREYGIVSYEQGQSLLEFSKLTKLRTLKIRWGFNSPDSSEGRSQAEGIHNYVGNLLSSCNIHNLYITQLIGTHPVSLDSWHSSASCNLRKLCIRSCPVYRVPNWMCSHGNLSVLELMIICVKPEDVEILGKIPSLLFLNISTTGGTNGRIIVHGKSGFRCLKYFSLDISVCGTILEFEVGSMPNVECVNLALTVHEMDLSAQDDGIFWAETNIAPSLGIHHLSALNKVEIKIRGDTVVRWVSRVINDAIKTLPNCPIVRLTTQKNCECKQFESVKPVVGPNEFPILGNLRASPRAFEVYSKSLGDALRALFLDECDLRDNFRILRHFLQRCPNLEKLTIQLCELSEASTGGKGVKLKTTGKGGAKSKKTHSGFRNLGCIQCRMLKSTEIIYKNDVKIQELVSLLLDISECAPMNSITLTKA